MINVNKIRNESGVGNTSKYTVVSISSNSVEAVREYVSIQKDQDS